MYSNADLPITFDRHIWNACLISRLVALHTSANPSSPSLSMNWSSYCCRHRCLCCCPCCSSGSSPAAGWIESISSCQTHFHTCSSQPVNSSHGFAMNRLVFPSISLSSLAFWISLTRRSSSTSARLTIGLISRAICSCRWITRKYLCHSP